MAIARALAHDPPLVLADRVLHLSQPVLGHPAHPSAWRTSRARWSSSRATRSDLVYTIEDGEIEIVRQRADGGEESLAVLGPGRYFGELGPLFGPRRSATAQVVEHAVLTGYTPGDFRELVGSGRLAEAISQASG